MSTPNISWIFGQRPASPFAVIAGRERRTILEECQQAVLTRENRSLISLRYKRDLSNREIAVATETSEDAVAQMHVRSIEKLRGELARRGIRSKQHI